MGSETKMFKYGFRCASIAMACALGCALSVPAIQSTAIAESSVVRLNQGQGMNKRINLGLNKSLVVDLPADAYDILVANPSVADAVTRTARRIYLFGKQVGQTNVFVFGPNGEQLASFDLMIERDVAGLEDALKKYIPDSNIKVELMNDNVILTGTVQTPLDAKRATDLATLLVSGGEATTGQYQQTAVSGGAGGTSVVIGDQDEARQKSKIVNLIQIAGDDQVTLKVTVAEVSRTVMKQLGVNLIASSNSGNGISFASETLTGLGTPLSNSHLGAIGSIGNTTIAAYLNAMELAGVMKTLAEPSLTAISGEKATFKVGGEYNIFTGQQVTEDENGNSVTTDHKTVDYGIGLEFVPVVLSPGRISLKVRTSVSEPTLEGSLKAPGVSGRGAPNILSIRKRLADTTVELPSGGSMMIAGLMRDDTRQAISGLPGLSKVPILGTLFRSRDFVRNESELVIIITPYLVRPVARTELARPDDNLNAASDAAGIFLGRVNRVYGTKEASLPAGRYEGSVGYIYK
ncbi:pilus assembly protein CpaC [Phyllobacterium sp. 1468]|uniref:type II and III secretion system protein family protein n=1 Tax=Phyllobacterium sp. 1468 TaxID=2817759 RepID=UPI002866B50C|nr:pilus assembly protein CpaC [Phyllobacterium sp. 1468]